jgi:VanZ family protein
MDDARDTSRDQVLGRVRDGHSRPTRDPARTSTSQDLVPGEFIRGWLPVLLWAGLIFGLSSIPSLGTGLGTWDLILRKLAHITEYAVLAVLLARVVSARLALGLALLYAIADEFHQTFVRGRHGSPVDVAVDLVGIVAGLLVARRLP